MRMLRGSLLLQKASLAWLAGPIPHTSFERFLTRPATTAAAAAGLPACDRMTGPPPPPTDRHSVAM